MVLLLLLLLLLLLSLVGMMLVLLEDRGTAEADLSALQQLDCRHQARVDALAQTLHHNRYEHKLLP